MSGERSRGKISDLSYFLILSFQYFPFQVRKLRFRRPRPKLIDVENPDGDLKGSPVELNLAGMT